jgi:hypothetical protein
MLLTDHWRNGRERLLFAGIGVPQRSRATCHIYKPVALDLVVAFLLWLFYPWLTELKSGKARVESATLPFSPLDAFLLVWFQLAKAPVSPPCVGAFPKLH